MWECIIGSEFDVHFNYDAQGRLAEVQSGTNSWSYGYLVNSDLISTVSNNAGVVSLNNL